MNLPRGITHLPSGHYRWRVWRGGTWYSGTEANLEDAVREREQMIAQLDRTEARLPTIRDIVDAWRASNRNQEQTQAVHEWALGTVPAGFMDRPLYKVLPVSVAGLWEAMTERGVRPHTQQKAQSAMSQAWQQALTHGITDQPNPFRLVRVEPEPADRVIPPTVDTVRRLIAALPDDLAAFARVMAVTGARPGEVCGLSVQALQGDTLEVSHNLTRTGKLTEGKNGRRGWRKVALDADTCAALQAVIGDRTEGLIFQGLKPDQAARAIKAVASSEGLDFEKLYSLRHFAASQALQGGATNVEVAAMLGDNPATVQGTYAHLVESSTSAALRNAEALA